MGLPETQTRGLGMKLVEERLGLQEAKGPLGAGAVPLGDPKPLHTRWAGAGRVKSTWWQGLLGHSQVVAAVAGRVMF